MMNKERMKNLSDFFRRLGFSFSDYQFLDEALTHGSYSQEKGGPDYQRLEFLGDALLQHYVSIKLFHLYPDADEGELTQRRSAMVRTEALAALTEELGLSDHLLVATGQTITQGMKADIFESTLAALYLLDGEKGIQALIDRVLHRPCVMSEQDYKSQLNERATGMGIVPHYETRRIGGPDHAPCYEATLLWEGQSFVGKGTGKKEAEQDAARQALSMKKREA